MFAQPTVLYHLIKLINETHNKNPKILEKINQKSHTLQGFSFNVTQIYLQNYNFECNLQNCFICNLRYLLESHLSCYEAELYANI